MPAVPSVKVSWDMLIAPPDAYMPPPLPARACTVLPVNLSIHARMRSNSVSCSS
jgi:hypothetical protein